MRRAMLVAVLVLMACDQQGHDTGDEGGTPATAVEVPENAIRVSDNYYMVPLVEAVSGCQAYRAFSPTALVAQAIFYRTVDGRFVMDRNEAACD